MKVKIIQIGSSKGIILTKKILEVLGKDSSHVEITKTSEGLKLIGLEEHPHKEFADWIANNPASLDSVDEGF